MLNKEFQSKDVNRLRNLVKGKYGEKTTIGIGYTKKFEERKEGDIWEENNSVWTIKDGIKQNVTKLDKAKELYIMPILCPNCHKPMHLHIDKPFYFIHKQCMNCLIDFETKLKSEGKWEEYKINIHNSEIDNLINEFKIWSQEELKTSNESFISEDGTVEKWTKGNNDIVIRNINESIKYLETLKK